MLMMRGMMRTANCGHWIIDIEFNPDDFWGFVYEIEEIATGRSYIGKKQFRFKRKKTRSNKSNTKESDWKEYTSSCIPLQEAIETQGKDKFVFRMLSLCSGRCQLTYEENQLQFARDVLRAKLPNGERKYWNKTIGHLLFAGVEKQTEDAKAKISAAHRGVRESVEARANMSIGQMGNKNGIGNKNRLGKKHTSETKSKIAKSKIGKKRAPFTARAIANMRIAPLRYVHTPEYKEKMSISCKKAYAKRLNPPV